MHQIHQNLLEVIKVTVDDTGKNFNYIIDKLNN